MAIFASETEAQAAIIGAQFANAAYGGAAPAGWTTVTPSGFTNPNFGPNGEFYDGGSGSAARVMLHTDGAGHETIAIAFRGTEPSSPSDLINDATGQAGPAGSYYQHFLPLIQQVLTDHPDAQIVFAGHSLAAAAVNQLAHDLPGLNLTFQQPPEFYAYSSPYVFEGNSGYGHVMNYGHANDLVYQHYDDATSAPTGLEYISASASPIDPHGLTAIQASLNAVAGSQFANTLEVGDHALIMDPGLALLDLHSASTQADTNLFIIGSSGADVILAPPASSSQSVHIDGGLGNDQITGNGGNDYLYGGIGNDIISGGDGNDFIYGGSGNNLLTGGAGQDTFVFDQTAGTDHITDFQPNYDMLDLRSVPGLLDTNLSNALDNATEVNGTLYVALPGGHTLQLDGVTKSDLQASVGSILTNHAPTVQDTTYYNYNGATIVDQDTLQTRATIPIYGSDPDYDGPLTFQIVGQSADYGTFHIEQGNSDSATLVWDNPLHWVTTTQDGMTSTTGYAGNGHIDYTATDIHGAVSAVASMDFFAPLYV